jgi:HPt (histidine-containing phosphotransfer) domain-containing protein
MTYNKKLTDLSYLIEMADNDKNMIRTMIDVFLGQIFEFDKDMHDSLSECDWAKLGAVAHKAKSSTRTMGMEYTSDCLEQLEHFAKGNKKLELLEKEEINWDEQDKKDWIIVKFEDQNDTALSQIPELLEVYTRDIPKAEKELVNYLKTF